MAKAMVKCKFCGKMFDRNDPAIKFIKLKNRYAHQECYDAQDKTILQEQEDLSNLINYISTLLGDNFEYIKTQHQIESYKTKHNFIMNFCFIIMTPYFLNLRNTSTNKIQT